MLDVDVRLFQRELSRPAPTSSHERRCSVNRTGSVTFTSDSAHREPQSADTSPSCDEEPHLHPVCDGGLQAADSMDRASGKSRPPHIGSPGRRGSSRSYLEIGKAVDLDVRILMSEHVAMTLITCVRRRAGLGALPEIIEICPIQHRDGGQSFATIDGPCGVGGVLEVVISVV